jgi:hypothetical protein
MRLDSAGNMGLGVTPSAWNSAYKVAEIGKIGTSLFAGTSSGNAILSSNAYLNSSDAWTYANNGGAVYFRAANSDRSFSWHISSTGSGTAGNAITFTQAMTLDASGNLGIGTTSPAQRLDVQGALGRILLTSTTGTNNCLSGYTNTGGTAYVGLDSSGGGLGASYGLAVYHGGAYPIVFSTNATERARIDSSGNLLVGTTSTSSNSGMGAKLIGSTGQIFSTITPSTNVGRTTLEVYSLDAAAFRFYVGGGGTVFATSTTISAISDIRFKENVRDLDAGLSEIMALQPRLYDWKEGKGANVKNARGFIAQEFEQVFPDLIDEWKDEAPEGEEPYKSVRADLIPVLVKAIQEQQAIIETLTARITALEQA